MTTPKLRKYKLQEIIIFLIILLITNYLLPQNKKQDTWVILASDFHPYTSGELTGQESKIKLSFPQEIEGELIGDKQDGFVKFKIEEINYFMPLRLLVKKINKPSEIKNLPIGDEAVDIAMPLPLNYEPGDMVKIDQKWNYHGEDYKKYLRKAAAEALDEMFTEAQQQGYSLKLVSAFRSFGKQRQLYLNAIRKNGIGQNIVAKPGHSEHQLGTTVDVSSFSPSSVLDKSFGDTKEGKWIRQNAARFGFYQSYTEENKDLTGYIPEPWHFRYIGRK